MNMNGNGTAAIVSGEITETQILNTIDAGYRTAGGIKKRLNVPTFKDITEDLKYLVDTGKIMRFEIGAGQYAYFRPGEKVVRAWLVGDGRVKAEFEGDDEKLPKPTATPKGKRIEFTPDDLEKATAENKSQPLIAKALGCSAGLIALRLQKKEFREAYERGVAKRNGSSVAMPAAPKRTYTKSSVVAEKPIIEQPVVQDLGAIDAVALPRAKAVQSKYITFSRGGQLLVAYEGSLFDLRRNEFELVTAIGDLLADFEKAASE